VSDAHEKNLKRITETHLGDVLATSLIPSESPSTTLYFNLILRFVGARLTSSPSSTYGPPSERTEGTAVCKFYHYSNSSHNAPDANQSQQVVDFGLSERAVA